MKSNPLSTRFVEPGRVEWLTAHDRPSLQQLIQRFTHDMSYRAAIVGPHGTGKSTLLEHLVPKLGVIVYRYAIGKDVEPISNSDRREFDDNDLVKIVWLRLRGLWPSVELVRSTKKLWARKDTLLVIDGYEQLPRLVRGYVLSATRRFSRGLLITSHRPTALSTLYETQSSASLVHELLNRLLPEDLPRRNEYLELERLEQLLFKHDRNVREVFMELYDAIEASQSR